MNISFWKHHPISDQTGEILAAETIEFYNKFKPNFLKITPAGTWIATCYGLKDYYNGDSLGRRFVESPLINELSDWNKIQLFSSTPLSLKEQLKAAELVCKEIHDVPVYATIFSPVTQAIQLCGLENFLKFLKEDPTLVKEGLKKLSTNTQQIIQRYIELGIEGIYYATQSCQKSQLSPEIYAEFGKSIDERCLEFASDLVQSVLFHLHGESIYLDIKEYIPFLCIHYEESETNTLVTSYPTIIGIPANKIEVTQDIIEIQQLINGYKNECDLILCGCVLPVAFEDKLISTWINTTQKMN
jgi:uroporphyrinogen decarboxylase